MGSQCLYFKDKKIPENVGLLSVISDKDKQKVFDVVDVALNPMISGSGMNLKTFDYMATGIPVITIEFGARGIDDRSSLIICEIDNMHKAIEQLNIEDFDKRVIYARNHIEQHFDWCKISDILIDSLENYFYLHKN